MLEASLSRLHTPLFEHVGQVVQMNQLAAEALRAIERTVQRVLANGSLKPSPPRYGIDEADAQFIRGLEAIEGSDAKARSKIGVHLHKLEGQPVTRAMVRALEQFLKGRGLAVQCTKEGCQEPAGLLWQSRPHGQGGLMELWHKPFGKRQKHKSHTKFPRFTVVRRPESLHPR
jgi:hypothetical protein